MLAFAIVLFSLQQPTAAPLPPLPPQVGDTSPFRSVSAGSEANPTLRTPPHARVRHRPVLSATADCGPTPPAPPSGGRHVAVPICICRKRSQPNPEDTAACSRSPSSCSLCNSRLRPHSPRSPLRWATRRRSDLYLQEAKPTQP